MSNWNSAKSNKIQKLYLKHDIDALQDVKLSALCADQGFEAYGLYWYCLERMWPEDELALPYKPVTFAAIKHQTSTMLDVKQFIDRCIEYELFDMDGDLFYSPALTRRMNDIVSEAEEKSKKARDAVNARWSKRNKKKEKASASNTSEQNSNTHVYDRNTNVYDSKTNENGSKNSAKAECSDGTCEINRDSHEPENASGQGIVYGRITDVIRNDTNKIRKDKINKLVITRAREDEKTDVLELEEETYLKKYLDVIDPLPSTNVLLRLDSRAEKSESWIIEKAIDAADEAGVKNWRYVNGVLKNCVQNNILTVNDWELSQKQFENYKQRKKGNVSNLQTIKTDSDYEDSTSSNSWVNQLREN